MQIDLKDWPALSRLLDEALDLPPEARQRWLDSLDPRWASYRPALQELLARDPQMQATVLPGIDVPTQPSGPRARHDPLAPGSAAGPYRLLRELGHGGMGVVWLAERGDRLIKRPVALKLPLVSVHNAAFLERFARERDFLAKLSHPNIARLYDAGVTSSGQQYIALEYIDGQPLMEHCDAKRLGVSERLRLFVQVLQAVQHAHDRQIVHRDLKPSNILVSDDGQPHLLDFGVAKVLIQGEARETALTQFGGRALTPDFASPEQVAGKAITAASDVYSLGVMLYELLCGSRPYRLTRESHAALEEAILATDPLPPSRATSADSVVAKAAGGPRRLAKSLAGDLDLIVQMALAKEPAERYGTAGEFAADIERSLAGQPIVARKGLGRRAASFFLRNRVPVAIVAVVFFSLGAFRQAQRSAADLDVVFERPLPEAQQVSLVSIGAEDYRQYFNGTSPLDPARLERLVRRIVDGGPAVLAVDIDTSHPSFAGLASSLGPTGNTRVVWARDASANGESTPVAEPVLGGSPKRGGESGIALLIADGDDGVVRRYSRMVETSRGAQPSFPWAIVSAADRAPKAPADATPLSIRYSHTDRQDIPASVVLAPGFEWGQRIANRIVVLGGRYDRGDVHKTPMGELAGMEVLANAIETELKGGGHPEPHFLKIVITGTLELIAVLLLFDYFPFGRAVGLAIAGSVVVSALLSVTGWLPAWPYSISIMLIVFLNQLGLELLRRHRPSLKGLVGNVHAGWRRLVKRGGAGS
jgi:serine/threonine protein kinase/CHASE2 domain-containing sensor protein